MRHVEEEMRGQLEERLKETQEKYLREIEEMQREGDDKERVLEEMARDRDLWRDKSVKLDKQIEKLKSAPKPVTIHLSEENFSTSRSTLQQNTHLTEENEYLHSHCTKLTAQVRELREEVARYEQ